MSDSIIESDSGLAPIPNAPIGLDKMMFFLSQVKMKFDFFLSVSDWPSNHRALRWFRR